MYGVCFLEFLWGKSTLIESSPTNYTSISIGLSGCVQLIRWKAESSSIALIPTVSIRPPVIYMFGLFSPKKNDQKSGQLLEWKEVSFYQMRWVEMVWHFQATSTSDSSLAS
jgi:hypothetical protein